MSEFTHTQHTTINIQAQNTNLEVLKKHFSHCFTKDGELDFAKLKTELSQNNDINFSKESYSLDWLGKSYARLLATDNATTFLTEDTTHNNKAENKNSNNLLIKGDNLEVLKHLSHAYHEKVKMIYIDPPYNTGGDGFVHQALQNSHLDLKSSLSATNIRLLKNKFNDYLMHKAMTKFEIGYKKVSNTIHPTKFTDSKGKVLKEVDASDIGVHESTESVAEKYFIDELFYDSELEKQNIQENIKEVIVFTKIPKNSIKIPVAGGKSYSPDFAYVVKNTDGNKKLNFVIETKNVVSEEHLRQEEQQKIESAKKLFNNDISITFKSQFKNKRIEEILQELS